MGQIGSCWAQPSWRDDVWGDGTWADGITFGIAPPSPTRLAHNLGATALALTGNVETRLHFPVVATTLAFLGDDGYAMSTPLIFTQNETGPITLTCTGADGTAEDLSTATSVTLRVVNTNGTVVVDSVALMSPTSAGTAIWTRQASQVGTAGDYRSQVKVVRSDTTVGYYPDAQYGMPLTILPAV